MTENDIIKYIPYMIEIVKFLPVRAISERLKTRKAKIKYRCLCNGPWRPIGL
jgi:hypothetical protein